MVRSKYDVANQAIRVFLQEVGKAYDKGRDFDRFIPSKIQKMEILKFFGNKCCFCKKPINVENMGQDHLIAMNKTSLGLHAWGNVVPCCNDCNKNKHKKDWATYLESISSGKELESRKKKIVSFVNRYKYKPNLHLQDIASNLYQDVGEVADTLIRLRYRQAEKIIKETLSS